MEALEAIPALISLALPSVALQIHLATTAGKGIEKDIQTQSNAWKELDQAGGDFSDPKNGAVTCQINIDSTKTSCLIVRVTRLRTIQSLSIATAQNARVRTQASSTR